MFPSNAVYSTSGHTLHWLQWTHQINAVDRIGGIKPSSFNWSSTSRPQEEIWCKATWGEARKTLYYPRCLWFGEKSIEVSMLDSFIFLCVNLIPSHGERKMSGWFEGKRWGSFQRQGGTLEGKRTRDETQCFQVHSRRSESLGDFGILERLF